MAQWLASSIASAEKNDIHLLLIQKKITIQFKYKFIVLLIVTRVGSGGTRMRNPRYTKT